MRNWLVLLALCVASPVAANQAPVPQLFAITVPGHGKMMVTVHAKTPEQLERAGRFIREWQERLNQRVERAPFSDYGGEPGAWSDDDIAVSYSTMIGVACDVVAGVVQSTGGGNLYFDAAGALCLSISIVTKTVDFGNWFYHQYEVSVVQSTISSYPWVQAVAYGGIIGGGVIP